MNTSELIKLIAPVVTPIIATFISLVGGYFIGAWKYRNFKEAKRLKYLDVEKLKQWNDHFENDKDSYNNFTVNSNKELHFYAITGIKTSYQNIPKYIKLKEKLTNYSWQQISDAKQFFCLKTEKIKLPKYQIVLMWTIFSVGMLLIIMGISLLYVTKGDTIKENLLLLFLVTLSVASGFFIMFLPGKINAARLMKKNLAQLEAQP